MAESILAVVEKLTILLAEEAHHLKGVKDKVEKLMNKLKFIQAKVQEEDAMEGGNELYNCWLLQLRDLGYQAVDVIETYRNASESSGFSRFIRKFMSRHTLVGEIDNINSRLEELYKSKDGLSIGRSVNPVEHAANARRLRAWRERPAVIKEDDYIDLVEDTEVLVSQLSSPRHSVVSIVGMGGLGKTTLANKLYNHTKLKFDCKAFISVSKEYRRKEILYKILEGVSSKKIDRSDQEEEKDLILQLHDFLKEKKYLVVLDDLWEKEDWDSLNEAIPSGMGCKVMLTTRNREVAKHAGCINPLEPRLLTEDESLELLRKKALPQYPQFPDELKRLGVEMVNKCGGLPLAVMVLGGLLSGKDPEEWEIVYGNSRWRVMNAEKRLATILSLSYDYLPFHLKQCFQHLALFPEDYFIGKKELIRLWVAERILPQQGEDTEERVAENCIHELIKRSMVMVGKRTTRERVKAIRIHDVLRDFAISKATEAKFLHIYTGKQVGRLTPNQIESRRVAIHGTYDDYAFLETHAPHLRSLHFFVGILYRNIDFLKNCKLLNVLDVDGAFQSKQVYKVLGNCTQLRYLAFRREMQGRPIMECLPSSFGKLLNLQTLDLRGCQIAMSYTFPDGSTDIPLCKMKRLRHLLLPSPALLLSGLRLDPFIPLTDLQTLTGVRGGRWIKLSLVKMVSMRQLEVHLCEFPAEEASIGVVSTLPHLESLSIEMVGGSRIPPVLEQLSNCRSLQKLHLEGKIVKLPGAHEFPPNLVKLYLRHSKMNQDLIATLAKLSRLKILTLDNATSDDLSELLFPSEGFPQLEVLHLISLREWEQWTVEQGAMINIKCIKIGECKKLANVSEGFTSMTSLRELHISASPTFERRLRDDKELVDFIGNQSIKLVIISQFINRDMARTSKGY